MRPDLDWIQILILVLFVVVPLIRGAVSFFSGNGGRQNAPGAPRRRTIHDVLDEVRREAEGEKAPPDAPPAVRPQPRPQERPARPPPRVRPPQPPRHDPLAPQPPRVQFAPRAEARPPPPARRPRPPVEVAPAGPVPPTPPERFRDLEHLESRLFPATKPAGGAIAKTDLRKFEIGSRGIPHEVQSEEEAERPRRARNLLGMDPRRAILAQVILGPPRCRERGRPWRPQSMSFGFPPPPPAPEADRP